MTTWGAGLHEDNQSVKTAQSYGNRGDGVSDWFSYTKDLDSQELITNGVGLPADAAAEGGATSGSLIALIKGVQKALGVITGTSTPTGDGSIITILKSIRDLLRTGIPSDATWMNASSGNVANAAAAASLSATSGKTCYVTGIEITFGGASVAANIIATLAGLAGGTISYIVVVPGTVTNPTVPFTVQFCPPLPASAANTAITVNLPALGSGNTHACVNIHGYKI
jgi:hypothetical protein